GRVLVVGTYRDTELMHDHPLLEVVPDLRRQGGVERLSLGGLDDVGVTALVEQASGAALDEKGLALARAVYDETEGNPFFVREVLRHLAETGAVERREGGWTTSRPVDELGIPEGVRDVVGRRLARLSVETNRTLRVAAVAGPEFELGVVQAAGELDENALLNAIEEAAEARVITEVSATRFRFAHALVRASLYESLTTARQVALHRKTAEAIEAIHEAALDDYVPALAHHWAKASAPVTDITRAVEYAQRAGDRALTQLAHDEAANYYASGLELLDAAGADPQDSRRLELLIGRGEAQRRAGDSGYRDTLLAAAELAQRRGDVTAFARAAMANTQGHIWSAVFSVDAERIKMLEAAIAAVGDDDPPVRARLLATLGLELAWEPDPSRRLALSGEALTIARAFGDRDTLAHVLLARDYTITGPENAAERLANTTELLAIAEHTGDPVVTSKALSLRFKAAMELADVAEAERSLASNQALVAELGQPLLIWATLHHQASLRIFHCEGDAEAAITTAQRFGESIGQNPIFWNTHWAALRLNQDRADEPLEWWSVAAERTQSPMIKALVAEWTAQTGDLVAAAKGFDELAEAGFVHPPNNAAWIVFFTECAWLCARLGRVDCVPLLRSALQPYAGQLVLGAFAAWIVGSVDFFLGVLAATVRDWEDAEARFAAAAVVQQHVNAPAWLARTHLEWARMLFARAEPGDEERAHDLLRQAVAIVSERGVPRIEHEAAELGYRP
ncbi:MAG TPA: hypothetical protein VFF24_01830, partial [Acidimicrobiia bacterium]|nr:hypothetical protein [Acidimicrobiia bacterium]